MSKQVCYYCVPVFWCVPVFLRTAESNPGRFIPGLFRPGSFRPIFGVGRFGLGRWVISANFLGESFQPRVVSAKV